MSTIKTRLTGAGLVALLGLTAACDDFVEVPNPSELEADAVDPEEDAEMFAMSAWQNLNQAHGNLALYDAWFTATAWVGDTFPTRNEFGQRQVLPSNGTHNGANWSPLATAIASGEQVINALEENPSEHLARGYLISGYGVLLQAEKFCEGTVAEGPDTPGPRMSTSELLDYAINRLEQAQSEAQAHGADELARVAQVGQARAHLFAGNNAEAQQVAADVPDDWRFDFIHADQAGERSRLGNYLYLFTTARLSLVVPPYFRDMADEGDPRIAYDDAGRPAQDGELNFYRQQKFPGWDAPIRFASGLEARYIEAEASGDIDQMLDLIAERREYGNQDEFESDDFDEVLEEFLEQRARDFWLEAKRMGDFRRNPDHTPFIIEPGDNYYKPELGEVEDQTCWPVTDNETDNNPNF